jgi:hypothetical protein
MDVEDDNNDYSDNKNFDKNDKTVQLQYTAEAFDTRNYIVTTMDSSLY